MKLVESGDTVRIVSFSVPSMGRAYERSVKVSDGLEVKKAGKVSFTVKTSHGGRNFKQKDIGNPVEDLFRGDFNICLQEGMSVDDAIALANSEIDRLLKSRINHYKKLVENHTVELERNR